MSVFRNAKTAIKFKGGSYQKIANGAIITFADVELETVLISLTKVKKIIRTEVAGKDGEVVEYIGMGSHEINISGTITGDPLQYSGEPREAVNALVAMIDAPISIEVVCPFLNLKGINHIVITDAQLPQEAGGINYQTFTINAISDIPLELRLSNV